MNKTPKSNPLKQKEKSHERAAARLKRETQEHLKAKINGSATIGRIHKYEREVNRALDYVDVDTHSENPEEEAQHRQQFISAKLALMDKNIAMLPFVMARYKSVEITSESTGDIQIAVVSFSDIPTE